MLTTKCPLLEKWGEGLPNGVQMMFRNPGGLEMVLIQPLAYNLMQKPEGMMLLRLCSSGEYLS